VQSVSIQQEREMRDKKIKDKLLNKGLRKVGVTHKERNGNVRTSSNPPIPPEEVLFLRAVLTDVEKDLERTKVDIERAEEVISRIKFFVRKLEGSKNES
jgi:hypothetical protein